MITAPQTLLTLTALSRRADCSPQTITRRIEAGLLKADAIGAQGHPLFEVRRIAEIKALLSKTEILA